MAPTPFPRTPYTLTPSQGGIHLALAAIGALPPTDPNIQAWNPFARNSTNYRNIILIGQDADPELRFLANHEHFNPYGFATVGAVLDCQRLHAMLYPGRDSIGLEALVSYCYPGTDTAGLHLHNAGNDAVWELKCCMVLLREIASILAPESASWVFTKVFDAVFVAMDVEAMNGRKERLTEFGFASLDSRHILNIHNNAYENRITARHLIIKGAVPKMVNGVRKWRERRYGGSNYDTDNFYPAYGASREIWPNQIPRNVVRLFFVATGGSAYQWLAPAGLMPEQSGTCTIQESSMYWSELIKAPRAY